MAEEMEERPGTAGEPGAGDSRWREALARVVPCVVVLKVTQTRACDTEAAGSSYATGFVVDKARGIILTNRHVVTPGPIVAEAIFHNREELPVFPVYYDPVHDFGFLRFDPSRLQFMAVGEVPLAPEAAAVGLDIRVVGNDSGEKISILAGTLARLDRDAPVYGRRNYNDFNTFYIQAASGTKGGSSGSPVIDLQGRAVALNAGGRTKAASAYYLPLERIVRALGVLRSKWPEGGALDPAWSASCILRGDLQTTFLFKGFDEVRRLGLRPETEAQVRAAPTGCAGAPASPEAAAAPPKAESSGGGEPATAAAAAAAVEEDGVGQHEARNVGMLVVDSVVPGSPADGVLEPGDVLVRVGGQVMTHFLPLEEALDAAVGGSVRLRLERGGEPIDVDMAVTDLHSVTPSRLLEVAGGAVHALSYQQARNNRAAASQVYVAEPGYVLNRASVPKGAIITALDGAPTPDLEAFAAALRRQPHNARVPLEFYTFNERHRKRSAILQVDRQWYGPAILWTRDDAAGLWHPTSDFPPGAPDAAADAPKAAAAAVAAKAVAAAAAAAECNGVHEAAADTGSRRGRSASRTRAASAATPSATPPPAAAKKRGAAAAPPAAADGAAPPPRGARAASAATPPPALRLEEFEARLQASLCLIDVDIPLVALTDGVHSRSFAGNGVVVFQGENIGLVLVDRNTVAVGPCDVNLSFSAHPAEITGRVRFLHPLHNFALVSYQTADLPPEARGKVRACELLPSPPLARGESVRLVGLTKFLRLMQRTSVVTNAAAAVTIHSAEVPRFRAVHEEVVKLDHDFGLAFSGVLTDDAGRVRALWGSYAEQVDKEEREWCAGLPAHVFAPWVEQLAALDAAGVLPTPPVRTLDAELEAVLLSKAAQFGLPGEWVSRLDALDPERRQVLRVRSTVANSPAAAVLAGGELILAIEGRPVTNFGDVDAAVAAAGGGGGGGGGGGEGAALPPAKRRRGGGGGGQQRARGRGKQAQENGSGAEPAADGSPHAEANGAEAAAAAATPNGHASPAAAAAADDDGGAPASQLPEVTLTIFDKTRAIRDVRVRLQQECGMGTSRLVHWAGAQLQAPHRAVRELGFLPPGGAGVYISRWHHGSPAHRYGLYALHSVIEVNGRPTPDMDTFLEAVEGLKDGDFARVKVCHLETTQYKVLSIRVDLTYFPTWELRLDLATATWQRRMISTTAA
ncbi:protease Do-like [Raphidocelis subcapitata]|uniref:Pro-apoptotic serine protease NMA111 n=1 Tax=Raphidocelis subcapitata TaxID=307507 RepID=A0A2V0P275_9CHLO|nr:protease Do-like [Raphidocelis subcapitata]|eukprot:GBF93978.1 protease Do-like [Raphidocelis subcapitata]